jgi:hypothetical protein
VKSACAARECKNSGRWCFFASLSCVPSTRLGQNKEQEWPAKQEPTKVSALRGFGSEMQSVIV